MQRLEGRVKCGKVNCEADYALCKRAGVSAYPTVQFYQPPTSSFRGMEITTQNVQTIINIVEERLKVLPRDEL